MRNRNILFVAIACTHPKGILVSSICRSIRGVQFHRLLKGVSDLKPLVVQVGAQNRVARVIVEAARPGLLAYGEVGSGYLVNCLQSAVFASFVAIQTTRGASSVGVVHHLVVDAAIQLQSVSRMHRVVEIGKNSLDSLASPEVTNPGASPAHIAEISLSNDTAQLFKPLHGRLDH